MNPIYILYAIPIFILLIGLEYFAGWLKKQNFYRFNDTITNLNIGIGAQVFSLVFKVFLLGVFIFVYDNFALFYQPISAVSFVFCLLLYDFLFYWAHRWGHEVNLFWGAHIVHHQSEEYNLSVALRQSWFHHLLLFFIFFPIPLLGFDPVIFVAAAAADTLYQFWIHTKAIKKLPKLAELILNTPSHHRVHHGVNKKYVDKNYAGVLIIWDKMFGTFQAEEEEPVYGISTPFSSWNPAWANIHYYSEMWTMMRRMSSWKDKVRMIFARPGWLPVELGGYHPPKEVNKETFKKFDASPPLVMNYYVFINFILIVSGLILFMYFFDTLSTFYKIAFLVVQILSLMICGAIFENKRWVVIVEYSRLVLGLIILNTYYYFWAINWFYVMLVGSVLGFTVLVAWFTMSWMQSWKQVSTDNNGL